MTTFNKKIRRPKTKPAPVVNPITTTDTTNIAGGDAFTLTPRMALYQQAASSLWSGDKFYEPLSDWTTRFIQNVRAVCDESGGREWALKLAAALRDKNKFKLRTVPVALFAEVCLTGKAGRRLPRQYAPLIIQRADELMEVLAYVRKRLGKDKKTWPHSLIAGLRAAVVMFNEYELAKYDRAGDVTLRDAFRIIRPQPSSVEQTTLWKKAVRGELATPNTWEVAISRAGKDENAKRNAWNTLIEQKALGTFALIRNLRNIWEAKANWNQALDQITEPAVLRSGILPFQWLKAYHALLPISTEMAAKMVRALEWSVSNIPQLSGRTVFVVDHSGSMDNTLGSTKSGFPMSMRETANLMASLGIARSASSKVMIFGTDAVWCPDKLLVGDIVAVTRNIGTINAGGSTHIGKAFELLLAGKEPFDRIVLLSDMQCYGELHGSGLFHRYRQTNQNCRLYSINLSNQDNTAQFGENDRSVTLLAGFSERVFDYFDALERGQTIIDQIGEM